MRSLLGSAVMLTILSTAAFGQGATSSSPDAAAAASAEPLSAGEPVTLELNKLEPGEGGCSLYFVVGNPGPDDLAEVQTEAFLFDKEGAILRGVLLQFQNIRRERSKVAVFPIADLGCDVIGRVLVNDIPVCNKADGSPAAGCADRLRVTSRAGVELAY
jgi:hypothetical protein